MGFRVENIQMTTYKLIELGNWVLIRKNNKARADQRFLMGSPLAIASIKARKPTTPLVDLLELGANANEEHIKYFLLNNKTVPAATRAMWALEWGMI